MTNAEYLHWQGVLTDLAYMGMSVVAGLMGWWMSREVERMSGKRKRILAQRRAMQRRITNLRRVRRGEVDFRKSYLAQRKRREELEELLDGYNPRWREDELVDMQLKCMASDPRLGFVITNLSLPTGL